MLKADKFKLEVESSFSNRHLNLIVFPTEKCNFRCTYCYEDFKIGKMKPAVVESLKRFLDRRLPTLDYLEFSWFGGEPLMGGNIITELHEYAISNKAPNCTIKGNMSTNGYLLGKNLFQNFVSLGLTQYQITIDGFEEKHDQTRMLANGNGTFDVIWSNLIECKTIKDDFEIILRLHYSKSNYKKLIKLLQKINKTFDGDNRFKVYLKAIENLGGPFSDSIEETAFKEQVDIENQLSKHISSKITQFQIDQDGPYICYASKPNSLAIRADGKISKCTVALNSESNHLGSINQDGTLNLNNEKLRNWLVGFKTNDLSTLACPLSAVNEITTANNV